MYLDTRYIDGKPVEITHGRNEHYQFKFSVSDKVATLEKTPGMDVGPPLEEVVSEVQNLPFIVSVETDNET